VVTILLPPPMRSLTPIFATIPAGASIIRIFDPTDHGATSTGFRFFGPLRRFDHHRAFVRSGAQDPERGIYYAALTFDGALVEVFGDNGPKLVELGNREVCAPILSRQLRLLDLRGQGADNGACRAGSVDALSKNADYQPSQAWSRYFYDHPELYSMVDGIMYGNAHNGDDALALYERAAQAVLCSAQETIRLDDPALRIALLAACLRLGLTPSVM